MKYEVVILSEAEKDIDDSYFWYEVKQIGLGGDFYKSINNAVKFISKNPESGAEIYKDIRRFLIEKFPFGIYYRIVRSKNAIQIIGVIHFKRSGRTIRKRI